MNRITNFFIKASLKQKTGSEENNSSKTDAELSNQLSSSSLSNSSSADSSTHPNPLSEKCDASISINHDPTVSKEKFVEGMKPCQPAKKEFPEVKLEP